MSEHDDLQLLKRLFRHKGYAPKAAPAIGDDMIAFFKKDVARRQPKLEHLSACWQQLVPAMFLAHTCLESFHRGTLTVLVDSASHLYEFRGLLLAGLEKQITVACKAQGLRKIALKPGQWYDPRTGAPRF